MEVIKCQACDSGPLQKVEYIKFHEKNGRIRYFNDHRIYQCSSCGHKNYYINGMQKGKAVFVFVKIGLWIKTNWRKVLTSIGDKVISKRMVYESHCWNCHEPIKSVFGDKTFGYKLGKLLYVINDNAFPQPTTYIIPVLISLSFL